MNPAREAPVLFATDPRRGRMFNVRHPAPAAQSTGRFILVKEYAGDGPTAELLALVDAGDRAEWNGPKDRKERLEDLPPGIAPSVRVRDLQSVQVIVIPGVPTARRSRSA